MMTRDQKIVASFSILEAINADPGKLKNPNWLEALDAAVAFVETMPKQEIAELYETDDDWIERMVLRYGASSQRKAREHFEQGN